jgi:uncharacterized spore protein YtfJ
MEVKELLERMAENVSVRRSFGAAYERDGALIIPVAMVAGGGGGGEGPVTTPAAPRVSETSSVKPAKAATPEAPPPMGTGGGFGGLVFPVGVYVVKDEQVRWVPAYAATLIILASLSVVRTLLRLVRVGQRHRD